MQTHSTIINKIISLLGSFNLWFEHSLLYRVVCAIKKTAGGSFFIAGFLNTEHRDYWRGSLLMRFIGFIFGNIMAAFAYIIRAFVKANEHSANKKIYTKIKKSSFLMIMVKAILGCVPVRLIKWFFSDCREQTQIAPYKVIYMLFLCGALVIPDYFWNNGFLLLSALFFAGVFTVKWALRGVPDIKNYNTCNAQPFSVLSPALVLFVLFCALSIFTGYGGADSARVFVIFFACVVHSILVTLSLRSMSDLRLFIKFIAAALAVSALFGFYQWIAGIPILLEHTDLLANPGLARLHSAFGNPNNDAKAWAMLIPFAIAITVVVKCDKKRIILAGIAALGVAALALTYSRAGYIALITGVGVFILMSAPRLVPVAVVLLVPAVFFIPAGVIERLLTLGTDSSSLYRFNIWRGAWDILQDYWIRGIGMGPAAFTQTYANYYHGEAWRALHAHNTFLDIFIHSGIGAITAFMAYLFRLFKRGISAHMASTDKEYKILMAAGIASLVVFIVFGIGEYVWFYPRVMLVFWMIAGITVAIPGLPKETHP
ncbi:MAG: O-antigen ligase family protein [Defluviitaleaceae bacterium]|nr:O-antigen ligase family protein [Defluviitaleaceae bacterium]